VFVGRRAASSGGSVEKKGKTMQSYTSQEAKFGGFAREALSLFRIHWRQAMERVESTLVTLREMEALLQDYAGFGLRDRDILDIGVGQFLTQIHYFALNNRAIGIDLDVIADGLNPLQYARMLLANGPRRTAKTLGRKLLGIDRRYLAEFKKQMGILSLTRPRVLQMDACKMTFADSSFDFVHSYSVFHHLPDPAAALDGIARVLRPGGVAYISLQLYTSASGFLDPRAFTSQRGQLAMWPHLRPECAGQIEPNAYVNKLRLHEWRKLFSTRCEGAKIIVTPSDWPGLEEAEALLARGELKGYSIEELLSHRVQVIWKKQ
jgi:SAM-dependent methyltransferase